MRGHCYAVASGKGGVGKTTTAVNTATAMARRGHDVVVVDADLAMTNLGRVVGVGVVQDPNRIRGEVDPLGCTGSQGDVRDKTDVAEQGERLELACEQQLADDLRQRHGDDGQVVPADPEGGQCRDGADQRRGDHAQDD